MQGLLKILKNKKDIFVILFLCVLIFAFSTLDCLLSNSIFAIANGFILLISLFFAKGKYRFYIFLFSASFSKFFNLKFLSIGSFYLYCSLFYFIIILVDLIVSKRILQPNIFKILILFLLLCFYALIVCLITGGIKSVFQIIGQFGLFSLVFSVLFDNKCLKNKCFGIAIAAFGLFASNVFASIIFYVIKGNVAINFLKDYYSSSYLNAYRMGDGFRYPGLIGDPNYLSFYTILITILFISCFEQFKFKLLFIALFVILHGFALLGLSKNYILMLFIATLVFSVWLARKSLVKFFIFALIFVLSSFLLLFLSDSLLPLIKRIIFLDTREGFLNALTTGRTTLLTYYLSDFLKNPTHLLFGNGVYGAMLDHGSSSHNLYVSLLWYFGIIGSSFYISYFLQLFKKKSDYKKIDFMFLIVIFLFGFSLDFSTNSIMFFTFVSLFLIEDNSRKVCLDSSKKSFANFSNNGYENGEQFEEIVI